MPYGLEQLRGIVQNYMVAMDGACPGVSAGLSSENPYVNA